MNVGMLWFDNDPKLALVEKVQRASEYYHRKYGRIPDLCMVHPSMLAARQEQMPGRAGKLTVRTNRAIQPGHLWIGEDSKN